MICELCRQPKLDLVWDDNIQPAGGFLCGRCGRATRALIQKVRDVRSKRARA